MNTNKIGELKDRSKVALNEFKIQTGTELYNRFMKGFVKSRENNEENENDENMKIKTFLNYHSFKKFLIVITFYPYPNK